jgi:hypothetical protein
MDKRDRLESEKPPTSSGASSPFSSVSESPLDQVASQATESGRDPQTADVSLIESWTITDSMVAAAYAVLRASAVLQYEAEGADQVLVRQMLFAAMKAAQSETESSLCKV